jgi:pimeloyl-ACP methyl ester carboxylesterase
MTTTGSVTSADGTEIIFDRSGSGPVIILVHGAVTGRAHPALSAVAAALAPWFTVVNYDRRGRGASGDTHPYTVDREVEDLAALIQASGGSAMVFGGSTGAGLAVRAAARTSAIIKLALWEPPYHVSADAPELPGDFAGQLDDLVSQGCRADAVELFMVKAAEVPPGILATMRTEPSWPETEAVAHTLIYEAAVMGPGNALPTALLSALTQTTLVLTGENSPAWIIRTGKAVCASIPHATHRVLEGQTHNVAPQVLIPELLEFFTI